MSRTRSGPVHDARPPEPLVHLLNPVVHAVLRSPVGRRIGSLALIDHHGRRTGEPRRVVTAWHQLNGRAFVATPAGWRANFSGGAPAHITRQGTESAMWGSLDADPESVAGTLRAYLATGGTPGGVGLSVAPGHTIDEDDVRRVRRAIVWFDATDPAVSP